MVSCGERQDCLFSLNFCWMPQVLFYPFPRIFFFGEVWVPHLWWSPFLTTGGWELEKCMYWNIWAGLKCFFFFIQYRLIYESFAIENVVVKECGFSLLYIRAVNVIAGWWLSACLKNCATSSLVIFQLENTLSIYLFQTSDLVWALC